MLNILSGFQTQNTHGTIKVNGEKRDKEKFRKQSTYIMQEENLYGLLTLRETMRFAIRLKTSARVKEKIDKKIMEVLENLGLELNVDTLVKNLSGGQQKRLSIAMELVDNPKGRAKLNSQRLNL